MVDLSPVRTICLLSEAGILSGYHFFYAITATSKSCSDLNSVLIIRAYGIMISSFVTFSQTFPFLTMENQNMIERILITFGFSLIINPFKKFKATML